MPRTPVSKGTIAKRKDVQSMADIRARYGLSPVQSSTAKKKKKKKTAARKPAARPSSSSTRTSQAAQGKVDKKKAASMMRLICKDPDVTQTMELMGFAFKKMKWAELEDYEAWVTGYAGFQPSGKPSHRFIPGYVTVPISAFFDDYTWTAKNTLLVKVHEEDDNRHYAILLDKAQARQSRKKTKAVCPKSRLPGAKRPAVRQTSSAVGSGQVFQPPERMTKKKAAEVAKKATNFFKRQLKGHVIPAGMTVMGFAISKDFERGLNRFRKSIENWGFSQRAQADYNFIPKYITIPTRTDFYDFVWSPKNILMVEIDEDIFVIFLDTGKSKARKSKKPPVCPKSKYPKSTIGDAASKSKKAPSTALATRGGAIKAPKRGRIERNGFVLVGNLWIHKSKLS